MEMIRAVFVTHDHADHIKAVGRMGETLNIPIYTTARIHEGINKSYCMTEGGDADFFQILPVDFCRVEAVAPVSYTHLNKYFS